jgi:SAM-dependent methyltransferase
VSDRLTAKNYWDTNKVVTSDYPEIAIFSELFSKYLNSTEKNRVAIEIGCVPGSFLAFVCKNFGYFPEGIDFRDDTEELTGKTLQRFGLTEYKICTADFLEWTPDKKYDLVLSMGFIEHFSDADEIVRRHIDLLKKGGKVVLEVPNFANGQKLLHYFLDKPNLLRHNLNVLNMSYFKTVAKKFGLKINYLGYYGGLFSFWWENQNANFAQKTAYKFLTLLGQVTKRINLTNKYFSPYIVMIAEKK